MFNFFGRKKGVGRGVINESECRLEAVPLMKQPEVGPVRVWPCTDNRADWALPEEQAIVEIAVSEFH